MPPSESLTIEQLKEKIAQKFFIDASREAKKKNEPTQTIEVNKLERLIAPEVFTHGKPPKITHDKKRKKVTHGNKFTHGEDNPKFKGWFIINGNKFNSTRAASLATGINAKTIYNRCMSNNTKGYSFEPLHTDKLA